LGAQHPHDNVANHASKLARVRVVAAVKHRTRD